MKKILILILLVALLFSNVILSNNPTPVNVVNAAPANFVSTNGMTFMLNGAEFKFVGFNLFDGAASDFYKCGGWTRYSDTELDAALKYAKNNGGATVLRSWAFQSYTKSGTDWTGLDKLLRIAKDNGFKVILSLENGPGHCQLGNNGQAKWAYQGDTWYTNGYKVKYGTNQKTFYEYIDTIVPRYKNDDTILAWELVNEPDTSMRTNGIDDCRAGGQTVIRAFASDLSSRIKALDSNHLVTVGAQSSGACGGSGPDYVDINDLPNIDFGTIHDYGYWGDPNHSNWTLGEQMPLPGSVNNDGITLPSINSVECQKTYEARMACAIAYAKQVVNKPVIVGEVGVSTTRFNKDQRAAIYDAKMNAAFTNGVTGYLVWQLNKVIDGEQFDVLTTSNDPLFATMKKYAGASVPVTPPTTPPTNPPPTNPPPTNPPPSSTPIACRADYNTSGTLDIADFGVFGTNYKKTGINCALDIVGDNCLLDINDFAAFGSLYKVSNACGTGTTPPPTSAVCGNNTVETGEVCDDGNTSNQDQCSSTCTNQCTSPQIWNGSSCITITPAASQTLKISSNGRFIQKSDNSSFFYYGDNAWELFHRLSREDTDIYLDNRRTNGFTVIQAALLSELDGINTPNIYGDKPLVGTDPSQPLVTSGSNINNSTEYDYWDHVDWVINRASEKGLYVALIPTWGDKVYKSSGIGPQVFNSTNALTYGNFLGNRYKDDGNVIWILGGDRNPIGNDTTDYKPVWNAMAQGIQNGLGGDTIFTYMPQEGGGETGQWFQDSSWLDINAFQSGQANSDTAVWTFVSNDYNRTPTKPVFDVVSNFEDNPKQNNPSLGYYREFDVRKQAYRSLFSGSHGITYGNNSVWQFYVSGTFTPQRSPERNWQDALNRPAATQLKYLKNLMLSRPFLTRTQDNTVLTSSIGSGSNRNAVTRSSDGSYAMVYAPVNQTLTINMTKISGGSVQAWWYDPRTGAATLIGTYANTGTRNFSMPSGGDFVLVLDDATQNFANPGTI